MLNYINIIPITFFIFFLFIVQFLKIYFNFVKSLADDLVYFYKP